MVKTICSVPFVSCGFLPRSDLCFDISLKSRFTSSASAYISDPYSDTHEYVSKLFARSHGAHRLRQNEMYDRGWLVKRIRDEVSDPQETSQSDRSERMDWARCGYDSAWAAPGIIGEREENCVRDPARIRITNVVLGNTREARRGQTLKIDLATIR